MIKTLKFFVILALLISCATFLGLMFADYLDSLERFPDNIYVENVDISFLQRGEAIAKLKGALPDLAISSPIRLLSADKIYKFKPSEIGIYIQPSKTIYRAFDEIFERNYFLRVLKRRRKERIILPLILAVDSSKMKKALLPIAESLDILSKDATFILKGSGKYEIEKEVIGKKVNLDKTISSFKEALKIDSREGNLIVETFIPRVKASDLKKAPPVEALSRYITYYGAHDSPNRIHNIKLIAESLDNTIMLSSETFSLLSAIGETSRERGFKEAYVIMAGELVPQYGGGACQIATTLYNAVLIADLDIIKRKNHGIYFYIYPLGRDAAVYSDGVDLQFRNNTGHPILLKASATDRALIFKVYGTRTGKGVSFGAPEIFISGEASPVESIPDVPFSTSVKRQVIKGDKVIKEDVIKSYYKFAGERETIRVVTPEPEE